ncbi:MAG: hypothetical protein ACE5MK_06510 [Acidobacteriota bacterium]
MLAFRPITVFVLISSLVCISSPAQRGYFNVTGTDFLLKTHLIFVGKLVERNSYRSDDGIFTRHIFEVKDAIKGDLGNRVEITEYGGTASDLTLTVTHNAHYSLGQEYLIFAYLDLLDHNRTLAGPLGQFQVISDRSGRRVIRIYPSHPLSEVVGRDKTFENLKSFSSQLRDVLEKSSH